MALKRKKKTKIILFTTLLALVLFFVYTFRLVLFSPNAPIFDNTTEVASVGDIEKVVNTTGEVGAVQLVSVGAQISGEVTKVYVVLGQEVEKGDLIAQIDSTTQLNELSAEKAILETYRAQLISAGITLETTQIKYGREVKLLENNATSKQNVETAVNELAAAEARIVELQSLIRQSQISLKTKEANLGYTQITAPLKGTIVSVIVEAGQTVNANQSTPNIAQIADLSKMEIKMQISEGDVTKIKPGMPVTYTILSEPDKVFHTTLKSIDPGTIALTNGTYQGATNSNEAVFYYGNLIVDNKDRKLHIGMTTQNSIKITGAKKVLVVSSAAIYNDSSGKKYVKTLDVAGKPLEKEVTLGLSDGLKTQITSGLQAGEQVLSFPKGITIGLPGDPMNSPE